MSSYLINLFQDEDVIRKIQNKLPSLFQLAELENSRAGKLGMEIGSARERIIIALLMSKFGEQNVNVQTPITKPEIDVLLFNKPVSIKTITGKLSGIKLIWTVDPAKALEFRNNYKPAIDMILAQINWGGEGWLYYFPAESQLRIFEKIGKEMYVKLPKQGTNPRGVEISKDALELLAKDADTMKISIKWTRLESTSGIYDRWVKLWED